MEERTGWRRQNENQIIGEEKWQTCWIGIFVWVSGSGGGKAGGTVAARISVGEKGKQKNE